MPWRNICPMEERDRFIEDWLEDELSMTELCAHFGVSRKTGYKWIGRFREKGGLGLSDASRAPRTHPNATRAAMEARVLDFRQRHPLWGPRKLLERLQRIEPGVVWPASSTIGAILKRNGMVVGRKRRRRVQVYKGGLSEGNRPNDVWAADFKGWFRTGDGTRIDPLTVSDLAAAVEGERDGARADDHRQPDRQPPLPLRHLRHAWIIARCPRSVLWLWGRGNLSQGQPQDGVQAGTWVTL